MLVIMLMRMAHMKMWVGVVLALFCRGREGMRMRVCRQLTGDETDHHGDGDKRVKHA